MRDSMAMGHSWGAPKDLRYHVGWFFDSMICPAFRNGWFIHVGYVSKTMAEMMQKQGQIVFLLKNIRDIV